MSYGSTSAASALSQFFSLGVITTFGRLQSMEFAYHDLGQRSAGEVIEITLSGNAANVRLMDSSNYNSYKNGRQHRYYGG